MSNPDGLDDDDTMIEEEVDEEEEDDGEVVWHDPTEQLAADIDSMYSGFDDD